MSIVLILGANSDVAKAAILLYIQSGHTVLAASRNLSALEEFIAKEHLDPRVITLLKFDAEAFDSHLSFYRSLSQKPNIVVYAAGFLEDNERALLNWEGSHRMMNVHYCGAVSILNIIVMDKTNTGLQRIIGLSSLSGVRGRKSNFIYGSTKSAFTQYLAGMRQYLFDRNIKVNVIVAGYIRSKMTSHLKLPESLMLEPSFIAKAVVHAGNSFTIVPGFKWKIIYHILRLMPERLVARLP